MSISLMRRRVLDGAEELEHLVVEDAPALERLGACAEAADARLLGGLGSRSCSLALRYFTRCVLLDRQQSSGARGRLHWRWRSCR